MPNEEQKATVSTIRIPKMMKDKIMRGKVEELRRRRMPPGSKVSDNDFFLTAINHYCDVLYRGRE